MTSSNIAVDNAGGWSDYAYLAGGGLDVAAASSRGRVVTLKRTSCAGRRPLR
jgi:hypothetical protein